MEEKLKNYLICDRILQNQKGRRRKMNYQIEEENECGETVASMTVKSTRAVVREINRWKKSNANNLIFVSWFRLSDGQHGYYNPSGDCEITGTAW